MNTNKQPAMPKTNKQRCQKQTTNDAKVCLAKWLVVDDECVDDECVG